MYKIIIKHDRDFVIEDLTHTIISAQEYFDVDLMPEAMAIANKIGATNEVEDIIGDKNDLSSRWRTWTRQRSAPSRS